MEALISLAIVGILAAVALPAYSHASAKVRVNDAAVALAEDMLRSSSSALAGSAHVTMCPSVDRTNCTGGTQWQGGWIVFVDRSANRERDAADPIINARPAMAHGVRILGSHGRERVTYQPRGHAAGTNGTFVLCMEGRPGVSRSLRLANSGRWRISEATTAEAARCLA